MNDYLNPAQLKFVNAVHAISELCEQELKGAIETVFISTEPNDVTSQLVGAATLAMFSMASLRTYAGQALDLADEISSDEKEGEL